MASPTQDMIDTYMSLTGASHSLALRKLEEYGGNLNEAVNAHFSGGDRDFTNPGSAATPQYSFTHMSDQNQVASHAAPPYNFPHMSSRNQVAPQGVVPLLSAARSFRPSLLFDPNYSRDLFNRIGSAFTGRAPVSSHPGVVGGYPVDLNRGIDHPHLSGQRPTIQNMTGNPHGNDVEEEMIRAAIEASKREAEMAYLNTQTRALNVSPVNGLPGNQTHQDDDDDFDRALSLSLKTAEQEKAIREEKGKDRNPELAWKRGRSLHQNGAEFVEQKQVSQELKRDAGKNLQQGSLDIHCEVLGSISSRELDEAIMLETAHFGQSSYATNLPSRPNINLGPNMQPVHCPSSSALTTRQLLREQQDDEYLASILADKEKEMHGVTVAGTCHLKGVEPDNKKIDTLEGERMLAAKSASLPCEPASDDENSVTLLVKVPNGSRLSRRFHKFDKLQILFDFIDVGGVVKPGTYRVVRSYPRRAFTLDDSLLTLSEVGLTNKQEALFLELI
ncbi:plant UBX domain-containing protein 9 [Prunus avium]|uniref:Plant UBX domain-containing protein 9 n=1 Tax=Prunus avium TaxID=42229 RepID=A0A6P5SS43_PRUAV|nr:plant UBX domain-containing protein 9 [Prunus avium]